MPMPSDNQKVSARVLVVDDEPSAVSGLKKLLECVGYVVETAGDAETALASARKNRPDVVVTDVKMPGMDGIALLQ